MTHLVISGCQHEFSHVSEMVNEVRTLGMMTKPVGKLDDLRETARHCISKSVGRDEAAIAVTHEHAQTQVAAPWIGG